MVLALLCFTTPVLKSQADSAFNYKPPQFSGGYKALFRYVDDYITYPVRQLSYGVEGGLSALIYISKEGKVKFVNVLGGNEDFRREIKRIMTLMPDWNYATLNGIPIDTFVIQRFVFSQERLKFKTDTLLYELNYYWAPYTDQEEEKFRIRENKRELQEKIWRPIYKKAVKETVKGNYDVAIGLYKESQRKGNNTAIVYYDMSIAYYNLGDYKNSCECLRESALRRYERAFVEYIKTCK